MIRLRQWLRKTGACVPLLVAFVLVCASCKSPKLEGPSAGRVAPSKRASAPQASAAVAHPPGMPGLMAHALEVVRALKQRPSRALAPEYIAAIQQLLRSSAKLHGQSLQHFASQQKLFGQKKLSAEMLRRLEAQRKEYRRQYRIFESQLRRLGQPSLSADVLATFERYLKQSAPQLKPRTPQALPFQRARPVSRPPMSSQKQYASFFGWPHFPPATPINTPTADELKETKDTKITPGLQALADQLKTPLEMYKWVKNNVEFAPTYGSLQGADHCRQSKRCNAFDTASLLIALLRAKKIAARYVLGTVEVPHKMAQNWLGRFRSAHGLAVGTALKSGGIPASVGFVGKTPSVVRMEHVWVEAWVDYIPHRGRVHVKGDTWIPMDPSFKQYRYVDGLDVAKSTTAKSIEGLVDAFAKGVKADASGGVSKVPSTQAIETQLSQTQSKLQTSTSGKSLTTPEIVGGRTLLAAAPTLLSAALPYAIQTLGQRVAELPDKARHYVTFRFHSQLSPPDSNGQSNAGAEDFRQRLSMAELSGKRIFLSYKAASKVDFDALAALMPQGPSTLTSLPSTIQVVPLLWIGDASVATGKTTQLGRDNRLYVEWKSPSATRTVEFRMAAGSTNAIVINPGAIASSAVTPYKVETEDLKKAWETDAKAGITAATQKPMLGSMLYHVGALYWFLQDRFARLHAPQYDLRHTRALSIGMFSVPLKVKFGGFGVYQTPLSVSSGSYRTDIQLDLRAASSFTDSRDGEKRFFLYAGGQASMWEASIWEYVLNRKTFDVDKGISTAHMFNYALANNVPIFRIDSKNLSALLPKLSLEASTVDAIKNAVNAGYVVVTPSQLMTKEKWKGVGYLILDSQTGEGAYMISGGLAGGELNGDALTLLGTGLDLLMLSNEVAQSANAVAAFKASILTNVGKIAGVGGAIVGFISTMDSIANSKLSTNAKNLLMLAHSALFICDIVMQFLIGSGALVVAPELLAIYIIEKLLFSIATSIIINVANKNND